MSGCLRTRTLATRRRAYRERAEIVFEIETGTGRKSASFQRAAAVVAAASRRFVHALIEDDPVVQEILEDDPASGLRRFGIGGPLAEQLLAEARGFRIARRREPPM